MSRQHRNRESDLYFQGLPVRTDPDVEPGFVEIRNLKGETIERVELPREPGEKWLAEQLADVDPDAFTEQERHAYVAALKTTVGYRLAVIREGAQALPLLSRWWILRQCRKLEARLSPKQGKK